MDPQKRQVRKLKREVKRAGVKRRRRDLKRDLTERPDEAHNAEYTFERDSSATLNGLDRDSTRRKER